MWNFALLIRSSVQDSTASWYLKVRQKTRVSARMLSKLWVLAYQPNSWVKSAPWCPWLSTSPNPNWSSSLNVRHHRSTASGRRQRTVLLQTVRSKTRRFPVRKQSRNLLCPRRCLLKPARPLRISPTSDTSLWKMWRGPLTWLRSTNAMWILTWCWVGSIPYCLTIVWAVRLALPVSRLVN